MSTSPFNETTTLSVPALTSENTDVTTASKAIETIVLVVIMTITTVGNVCLWVIVLRSRALRTLTSMFILGLSTAGKEKNVFWSILRKLKAKSLSYSAYKLPYNIEINGMSGKQMRLQ
ncbi:hypothetical protein DPMN_161843 [Dreissena polymorpha]|uniref:Uncharacterized protein n=1 Tax=Dreissena polymorpha TaxID=45954 RepID=A0A9D4EQH4_DREPO|nr:hypothetical protein DPMN_161843 [Dreissena polymorpha]